MLLLILIFLPFSQKGQQSENKGQVHYPEEKHLVNIRQLTFGGDNAEAYFSPNSSMVVFQATNSAWNAECDQIFYSRIDSFVPKRISNKMGRTTCSYFLPGNETVLYASTYSAGNSCPPKPPPRPDKKYVWPLYPSFDIYVSDLDGNMFGQLTTSPGYDAEATVSPKGDKIVFTSTRSGDPELYTMDIDGKNVKQITNKTGYDGGAFFSPDGNNIIFRASRPKTPEELKTYKELLAQDLVMPTAMELFICKADGSGMRQLTRLGGANWAPFFSHDGKRIIFSSNHKNKGFHFNLWMIKTDGTGLEQITYDPTFDAFPVFSPDGKHLVFSSNRNNNGTHDTNLFIADWKE
jgi:Tol biopolymer transport system component